MATEHVEVLIVGAGLSGVGAACHLAHRCPGKTFAILEGRESLGGTWDLFRYPGIRSDSDMFTLGYVFRPWKEAKAIADGPSILNYVRETARDHGVMDKIRFNRRVVHADWSSADSCWTVQVERSDTGETEQMTCGFLFACTGYYRYEAGYTPDFEGTDRFAGPIVHPQHWPEDLDYAGKRVVVIGSGATAVTLVPAMAKTAEHVTMLQRSPSYVLSLPAKDPIAQLIRRVLPPKRAYPIVRWKNVIVTSLFFQLSRRRPKLIRKLIRRGVERELPGFDVEKHFNPRYNPWDQRMCLVPDGDLFEALRSGDASVVTDTIETFTEDGIKLTSGEELAADVIITATGLHVQMLGGMTLAVDGEPVEPAKTVGYKGMMLSGVPNMAMTLGYTNASWTLKCDLCSIYVCRLLNHMDEHGYAQCTPQAPGPEVELEPFIDFNSGYVVRAIDRMPKQGSRSPWRLHQNYARDIVLLKRGSVEGEAMEFSRGGVGVGGEPVAV
jgi:monooxygenase